MLHRFNAQAVASDPTRTFLTLPTPAGKPQLHVDADRSARVAQITSDLLAHGPALRLRERQVRLPAGPSAPLERSEKASNDGSTKRCASVVVCTSRKPAPSNKERSSRMFANCASC